MRYMTEKATIKLGESLSDVVDLRDYSQVALEMPAGWSAADITFQACSSHTGIFKDVLDDDENEVSVKVGVNEVILLDDLLAPLRFIKLRSGTSGTPVNQVAIAQVTLLSIDASGGTFNLEVNGEQILHDPNSTPTEDIPWDISDADLQTAINDSAELDEDVSVSVSVDNGVRNYTIAFNVADEVVEVEVDDDDLTGEGETGTVSTTTAFCGDDREITLILKG